MPNYETVKKRLREADRIISLLLPYMLEGVVQRTRDIFCAECGKRVFIAEGQVVCDKCVKEILNKYVRDFL